MEIETKTSMKIILSYIKQNAYIPRMLFVGFLMYLTVGIYFGRDFSPLSNVDLLFHEIGHVLFLPFGAVPHLLGGSLLQLLIPIGFLWYFIKRNRNHYSAAIMLWWVGENLTNISIYMSDANARNLPLLGGNHDWFMLFNRFGALPQADLVGDLVWHLGIMILLTGLMWGLMTSYRSKI